MSREDSVVLWSPQSSAVVPNTATNAAEITAFAKQLSPREQKQIIAAFNSGSYEMASVFLWSRAMVGLKKQIASLGMEFVGEMLDRGDISSATSIVAAITDFEALGLAEELGIFGGTQAMRLRHSLELVSHFSDPSEMSDAEEMMPEEALQVARACVQAVLGHEHLEGAIEFTRFRKGIESRTYRSDDAEIESLIGSPPFFQRTTLRVLVAQVKTLEGVALEHAMANFELIVPLLWEGLAKPECWLVGRAYAEVHSSGKKAVAASIRRTLMAVHGFDFVPEDLRSRSFILAAKRVKDAHFEFDNFHNEVEPMRALASLGSVIPMPAFSVCMSAIMCVILGNRYGVSWGAAEHATKILQRLSRERWRYYLDECLRGDDAVLAKISNDKIVSRWMKLVETHEIAKLDITNREVKSLVELSGSKSQAKVVALAKSIHVQSRQQRS